MNDVGWSLCIHNCYNFVVLSVFHLIVSQMFFVLNSRINFKKTVSYSFQIADQYDKLDVIREIVSTEGPKGACILTSR